MTLVPWHLYYPVNKPVGDSFSLEAKGPWLQRFLISDGSSDQAIEVSRFHGGHFTMATWQLGSLATTFQVTGNTKGDHRTISLGPTYPTRHVVKLVQGSSLSMYLVGLAPFDLGSHDALTSLMP